MCLQDYQLARGVLRERLQFSLAIGVWIQAYLPENDRIGVLILGPSTGSLEVNFGSIGGDSSCGLLGTSTTMPNRYFSLFTIGLEITNSIWLRPSANAFVTVVEYKLPTDPESLNRLAATGKW